MKPLYIILLLIGLVGTFLLGYHCRSTEKATVRTDTVIQIDTLREIQPVPVKEVVTKYITLPPDTVVK